MKYSGILLMGLLLVACYGPSRSYKMAEYHFKNKAITKAQRGYEKALKRKRLNRYYSGWIHYHLAECIRLGSDSIASDHYAQAISNFKVSGGHPFGKYHRREQLKFVGMSYYHIQDTAQAIKWLNKYLVVRPENCEIEWLVDQLKGE